VAIAFVSPWQRFDDREWVVFALTGALQGQSTTVVAWLRTLPPPERQQRTATLPFDDYWTPCSFAFWSLFAFTLGEAVHTHDDTTFT
jgi:hypothetical protein